MGNDFIHYFKTMTGPKLCSSHDLEIYSISLKIQQKDMRNYDDIPVGPCPEREEELEREGRNWYRQLVILFLSNFFFWSHCEMF